jgi:hypothetical protein
MKYLIIALLTQTYAADTFNWNQWEGGLQNTGRMKYIKKLDTGIKQLLKEKKEQRDKDGDLTPKVSELIEKRSYLERYKELLESKVVCEHVKAQLIFGFSPQNPNPKKEDIPKEAQWVIDLATKTCPHQK